MPGDLLNKRNKIFGHILFWMGSVVFLCLVFYFYGNEINLQLLGKSLVINVGIASAVYTNLYLLIPRFLKQKHYIFYVFWLIVTLSVSSFIIQFLFLFPFKSALELSEHFESFNSNIHSAFFFSTLFYIGLTSLLKFIKDWLTLQDLNYKLEKIEKQKLKAELASLKGQLNPHFLFNSLNNIYSLALIKSDNVPDLILRLSDLMRHIIYESKENYIALEKEIEFVDNFVALQKIRTSEKTKITYTKNGNTPSAKIAPLLFEPFIDNAFKHGIPGNGAGDFIEINFNFEGDDKLNFEIKNNYDDAEKWNNKHSGIGIQNVKQRLKHLYKPDEYSLKVTKENQIFAVQIQLKLK